PGTHKYMHGEEVAFGTLCHLMLENAPSEEIEEVLSFCLSVGLPVCLKDLGVDSVTPEELRQVAEKASIPEESTHAMPFPVTAETVAAAIVAADKIGSVFKQEHTA
ncbi:MAG: iron-containing alcohol dehydrogenase, partial [Oscillibacter sp.]|nr:iron-containing alcohol dehydrogenase [Oscillibacter sp.]